METDAARSKGMYFWRRPNDDPKKIIAMAMLVAFVCALVVSSTELLLMPRRQANIDAQREAQMASMLSTLPGLENLLRESGADSLQTHIVDLASGQITTAVDAASFDQIEASADPLMSTELISSVDVAGLGRRANYAPVYLLYHEDSLKLVILPVHGQGYQSVIRAWLALSGDLNTVEALSIYAQAETPGLGSRIEEPEWLEQFTGKKLRDESGFLRLSVVKGNSADEYQIDGISGATRTGNGINNLIAFWLGDEGFGPFLTLLAEERHL